VHRVDYTVADPKIREIKEAEPTASVADIGRRLRNKQIRISNDSVRKRLAKMGYEVKRIPAQFPARDAELVELAGHSVASIAEIMGVSKSTVGRRATELGTGSKPPKSKKPQTKPEPQQTNHTSPNGYPRRNGEIPPYIRTLPILPSISGPKFGDAICYFDKGVNPMVLASSADQSGKPSGSDPSSSD